MIWFTSVTKDSAFPPDCWGHIWLKGGDVQLTKEDASTDTAPPHRGPPSTPCRRSHGIASRTIHRPSSSHGAHSHSHPARHLSCSRWPQRKFSRNVKAEFDVGCSSGQNLSRVNFQAGYVLLRWNSSLVVMCPSLNGCGCPASHLTSLPLGLTHGITAEFWFR